MANGKGSALSIIALIIGVIGIGAGAYSIIKFQIVEGPQGPPGENGNDGADGTELLAIWEHMSGSGSSYNITFTTMSYNNSGFFSMGTNNESILLTQVGWYKMNLKFLWEGLTISETHGVIFWKNGLWEESVFEADPATNTEYSVDSFVYFYCDGSDEIGVSCLSTTSSSISAAPAYNQVSLEYVG